jgi:carboxypeptidase family protein/TonB-dependent receptor-like protein
MFQKLCVPFLAGLFGLCLAAYAQDSGRLTGAVVDQTGAVVAGATVNLILVGSSTPALTTTTTSVGLFTFIGVRPATYDLSVEAPGLSRYVARNVVVDGGRETAVPAVKLEVGTVAATVEVAANTEGVQTANAEISTTVTNEQVRRLPSIDRNVQGLIFTQPGVTSGRGDAVVNGTRPSYTNVTLDGINIQDNFIRTNDVNFSSNLLLLDQVAEITVATSNTNSAAGGGASQVNFITPSGTNQYHGSGYWSNRNSAMAANTWFNNQGGIARPFLNQNQIGGTLGGRIIKDRLFFYLNYEAFRLRQQTSANTTILTGDARNGAFTYRDAQGAVQKVNVLAAAGVAADPTTAKILAQVPSPDHINNFRVGDSSAALLRNTGGYSFLRRNNRTRDNSLAKLDYNLSTKHVFTGAYSWWRDVLDRPDAENDYATVPKAAQDNARHFITGAWRWTLTPTLTSELRAGWDHIPVVFTTSQVFPAAIISNFLFSNPVNTFQPQGRATNNYNVNENANYVRGKHAVQFGLQFFQTRFAPYDNFNVAPTYNVGVGVGHTGLTAAQLPGIGASDLAAANSLLANLAGYINDYIQTFNVTSKTSGFVAGARNLRRYELSNYALYAQDNWKVSRRLTLNLGLRWDYLAPVKDLDGLGLLPVIQNNNPIQTILNPNATLDFTGSGDRPFYKSDKNNFAPHIGLSWDVLGKGKTVFRGGYSISFVNDELGTAILDQNNPGLQSSVTATGLKSTAASLPPIPVPTLKVPRTVGDNWALSNANQFSGIDPGLVTPYVQQYSFGIQQDIKGTIVEVRYVGNHGTKELRAFDYNQVNINPGGFLQDFLRAKSNGDLARKARGVFDPQYNPAISGSQQLTVFPLLGSGGLLTNSTITTLIDQGQVGTLAQTYVQNNLQGPLQFFQNNNALIASLLTNYSNSTYNSLQVDVRHRVRKGFYFQGNYVFSKVLSDAVGDSQSLFEEFLDIHNAKIERARTPYDITHVFKANSVYDLPIGPDHRLRYAPLDRVLGGWSISGIWTYQSGTPFSILSTRGTLNRGARSGQNTAVTTLDKAQLDQVVGFRMTGTGPYFIAPSALGADGRGVAPDGSAPFQGQVFSNPTAGSIGTLQRRMFSGPWDFSLNFGVQKVTRITERQTVELRMEAQNIMNHPTFYAGESDPSINSTTFGKITSTFFGRRLIQFALYYRF